MHTSETFKISSSQSWSYLFNTCGVLGICGTLIAAFYYQIAFNELPCPLCQLQRVALILAGIGMMLNMRFGASAVHYAIVIASSVGGAFASARQDLLHIAPGDAGYGSVFLGLHFYTWGVIAFVIMLIFCAMMLCIDRKHLNTVPKVTMTAVTAIVMYVFLALSATNVVSSVMVCQFGSCPDNPTSYLWSF